MKRTLGWIITWLAAVGLLLSFAPAVHRSDHSRDARGKRSGGSSTEFLSCRILPAGGTIWIPSRGGHRKSSRVSDVFLMRVPDALLARGPVWVNRRGPPGGYLGCLPGLCGCGSNQRPERAAQKPFSPRICASVNG
jgi:hypothetical protein